MKKIMCIVILLSMLAGFFNSRVCSEEQMECSRLAKSINIGFELAEPVIFVADNHFHNIYTDPALVASLIGDIVEPVAIRPSQLNLFAPDLFVYAMKQKAQNNTIIHLGDALNISSTYEWELFIKSIYDKSIGCKSWFMIPGNHDAYFYGNSSVKNKDAIVKDGGWINAANTTGVQLSYYNKILHKPFYKNDFVKSYIDENIIKLLDKSGVSHTFYSHDGKFKESFEWENDSGKDMTITKISGECYDDNYNYWRSFIVQELRLASKISDKTISLILLDTTNYSELAPKIIKGIKGYVYLPIKGDAAGVAGEISPKQMEIVDKWIKNYTCERFMLIGHHQAESLVPDSQKWLKDQLKQKNCIGYMSAHTHDPIESFDKNSKNIISELNIASITDVPQATSKKCHVKPSQQYAILEKNGYITVEDGLAEQIIADGINHGFPVRSHEYYLTYKLKKACLFFDSAKAPHRDNLKTLAQTYIDMFGVLYCGNEKTTEILLRLTKIASQDKIKKHDVLPCVETLKEAQKIDDELRKTNEDKRLIYGAFEAVQASLAEAGYRISMMNPVPELIPK